jgi:hypothetical protein
MIKSPQSLEIQSWNIERFVFYVRNPRKNDAAVDRMCSSIREFGFKVPVLARSDGAVVDGHLRLKSARKLGSWPGGDITAIPVILCDEWSDSQVKAFRLMVNRSNARRLCAAQTAASLLSLNGNYQRLQLPLMRTHAASSALVAACATTASPIRPRQRSVTA